MHSHFLPFSFWSFISRDSHNLYVSEFLIAICRKCLAILSWKYVERVTRTHRTETGNPGWEYGWTPQCSGVCRWDHAADASWSAATRRWHPPPPPASQLKIPGHSLQTCISGDWGWWAELDTHAYHYWFRKWREQGDPLSSFGDKGTSSLRL